MTKTEKFKKFIDSQTKEFTFGAAKDFYDNLGGANPKYTTATVQKLLDRFAVPHGLTSWVSKEASKSIVVMTSSFEPTFKTLEQARADFVTIVPQNQGQTRFAGRLSLTDVLSWDVPVLQEAIRAYNDVYGYNPGDEKYMKVDFKSATWMDVYDACRLECGCDRPAPLDMAQQILMEIVQDDYLKIIDRKGN